MASAFSLSRVPTLRGLACPALHAWHANAPSLTCRPFCSYETYDELYDYCYRVAGTVALMSVPVMGVDKSHKVGAS